MTLSTPSSSTISVHLLTQNSHHCTTSLSSTMSGKKIITVFGATGVQGGSVADIFLHDPKLKSDWTVRAVTRDTSKESAKRLQQQGAEVVAADLNDKSTLVKAMEGATAVFAVTNYWEKCDMKLEIQQGKNLVDAAKEAGVQQFIWSSLYNIAKLSNGKLPNVYHFDSKALVEDYAREVDIPATFFLAGSYMSNLPGASFRRDPQANNAWTLSLPVSEQAVMPVFDAAADTGKFIKAAVLNRDKVLGKRLLGATNYLTNAQIIEGFKKVFPEAGKTASYKKLPDDVFREFWTKYQGAPEFVAQELLENMQLFDTYGYFGGESLDETHALLEDKLTTWEEYAAKTLKWGEELK
ncbi:NmrA-like family-domain-containing protein [Apiosordaria backusii]|uniref:NmrA-like family domain-containing protein 1 n=1 Tax=Apiosordaria backusii TaxID=314023 RepID=A0AA40BLF0_9PEZI|nr:NmrA-like family-domain-containing protein [Apiosordaria backusii]